MRRLWILCQAVLLASVLATPVYAADIAVDESCSLADAMAAANADAVTGACIAGYGDDVITLSGEVSLSALLPPINSNVTIEAARNTVSGDNRFRIFTVRSGGTLTINELNMRQGYGDWGGAIANLYGTIVILNSTIVDSSATEGGAIGNDGSLSIKNTTISGNSAPEGGAIHHLDGEITIAGSTFELNSTEGHGGAILMKGGSMSIADSFFSNNSSGLWTYGGGAIASESSNIDINESLFRGNTSAVNGGAIFFNGGTLTIFDSTFNDNSTVSSEYIMGDGGVIYNNQGNLLISKSLFHDNFGNSGGAIYNNVGTLKVTDSHFRDNSARKGGGIYNENEIHFSRSSFAYNSATVNGGAVYSNSFLGDATIVNSTFWGNSSGGNGGAIYVASDKGFNKTLGLSNSTLTNNQAEQGGGLYKDAGATVNVVNSIVAGNTSGGDCFGRLKSNTGNLIEDGSCFVENFGAPMLGDLVEPDDGSPAYFPLLPGSPAIDAADSDFCPATDQIGAPRPQGKACDIGAIEFIAEN